MNNIVFCIDKNMIELTKYVVGSFFKFHDPKKYMINYLLYDEEKKIHLEINKIIKKINPKINVEFKYLDIPNDFNILLEEISKKYKDKHRKTFGNKANWSRFFIQKEFSNVDKILYLDYDILILNNMDKLFEKSFNDLPLMAVPYSNNCKKVKQNWNITNLLQQRETQIESVNKCLEELNIKREDLNTPPYNCGVMFLNLELLRKNNFIDKIKDYLVVYLKNGRFHRPSGTQTVCNLMIPNYIHLESIYNILGKKTNRRGTIILHFKGYTVPNSQYLNIFDNIIKK